MFSTEKKTIDELYAELAALGYERTRYYYRHRGDFWTEGHLIQVTKEGYERIVRDEEKTGPYHRPVKYVGRLPKGKTIYRHTFSLCSWQLDKYL